MKSRMQKKNLVKSLQASVSIFFAIVLLAGCSKLLPTTKKKELKSDVGSEAYVDVNEVQGNLYSMVRTTDDVQGTNNLIGATPGEAIDYGLVRAEITRTELRFVQAYNPQNRDATANVIASFPITDRFDIERERNDFNEETHKIVEKKDKPWNERRYMRVDWAKPSNSVGTMSFQAMYGLESLKEENVDLVEEPKIENGNIAFAVDATLVHEGANAFNGDRGLIARVKMRTHLTKVKPSDYVALEYSETDFSRFGMFFTEQKFNDKYHGLRDQNVKHYVERFNVCEANIGRSCSTAKIEWHLTHGFPEEFIPLAEKAVAQYNTAMKQVLRRSDDVVVLNKTDRTSITDPTKHVIAYYGEDSDQAPLGVRMAAVDPRTGEILGARVTIYGAGINSMMGQVDEVAEMLIAQREAEARAAAAATAAQAAAAAENQNGQQSGGAGAITLRNQLGSSKIKSVALTTHRTQLSQHVAGLKALGLSTSRGAVGQPAQIESQISEAKQLIANSRGSANTRYAKMLNSTQTFSYFNDLDRITAMGGQIKPARSDDKFYLVRDLMKKGPALLEQRRQETRPLTFANVRVEALGNHKVEFLEAAALRFIERELKKSGVSTSAGQREHLKSVVAENTFYHVLLHEMGHAFGLRHNFAGSADQANFTQEFKDRVQQVAQGKGHADDLHGAAYSSVMDYAADFYLMDAGLGPYDKAALEYAYSNRLDRSANSQAPIVKQGFKFCTDDNHGEDITCRRWDRGTNASTITQFQIGSNESTYLLSHFRRDRYYFGGAGGVINRAFNDHLRIRQAMDELIYQMQRAPGGGGCGRGLIAQSIAAGEMLDICGNPALADVLGIDFNDLGTFVKALYKDNGELLIGNPARYKVNGFADLLYASSLAMEFFQNVIGAPEPGYYLVEEEMNSLGAATGRTVMTELPMAGNAQQSLAALAQQRGEDPDEFVQANIGRVLGLAEGRFAKYFESRASGDQLHRKAESIGFFWDKYVAMTVLGLRDIGVSKYFEISMNANAYLLPHTRNMTAKLFERLITSPEAKKYVTSLPIVMQTQDGQRQVVDALVPAGSDRDLEAQAAIIALAHFSTPSDLSFADNARICVDNETCPTRSNLPWVRFKGLQHDYKAIKTSDKTGSIAASILESGADLTRSLEQIETKIRNRATIKGQIVSAIQTKKNSQANRDLEAKLTAFIGSDEAAKAHDLAHEQLAGILHNMEPGGGRVNTLLQLIQTALGNMNRAGQAFVAKANEKLKGVDVQKCAQSLPEVKPGCEPLAEVLALQDQFVASREALVALAQQGFDLGNAEDARNDVNSEIRTLETRIQFVKEINDIFN